MSINTAQARPDAFKARMAEAQAEGRPELANQSRGRPLSKAEQHLANAMMTIFADGTTGEAALALALTARGIVRPSSEKVDWTADNIASEFQALGANLDEAYQQNGFGA
jgi:hypothetical protein